MTEAEDAGRAALAEIDHVLAAKPGKDDQALSRATASLCQMRDRWIAERGEGPAEAEARRRLEHLNAVIGAVLALHFPLAKPPWGDLAAARGWLAALLEPTP